MREWRQREEKRGEVGVLVEGKRAGVIGQGRQ
jgi:hypothetical protein